jgi:hypothetical protein
MADKIILKREESKIEDGLTGSNSSLSTSLFQLHDNVKLTEELDDKTRGERLDEIQVKHIKMMIELENPDNQPITEEDEDESEKDSGLGTSNQKRGARIVASNKPSKDEENRMKEKQILKIL